MANIVGEYPLIERVVTGLWSLDRAMSDGKGGVGIPMTFMEMFGFQGIGKTTFSTSLMSIISNHYGKKIVYAPFEHVDRKLMGNILDSHECDNEVTMLGGWDMVKRLFPSMKEKEKVTDELVLDCFIEAVRRDEYCVGVVDSLSSLVTIAEAESSVADRNMGKARVVSAFSRSVVHAMRMREGSPFATIVLSHKTVPMGGGTPTNTGAPTTGGEVKKNVAKVRIGIRRIPEPAFSMDSKKNIYDEHAYILEGKVEKNNFGREGKTFWVSMLGGKGAHIGLTAMYECKKLGICSFGKSVNLGGQKFGSIATMLAKAHAGQDGEFQPFIDALKNPSKIEKVKPEDSTEEDGVFYDEAAE